MKQINLTLKSIVVVAGVLVCSALAHGQQRTFVSGLGNDANPCTRASPCRGFQRAHDVVATGGEVVALDSAGYASFTITKSVTISGEGIRAAVTTTVAGTRGITISAAGPITVILREITVTGLNSTGMHGVEIFNANDATVYIERCVITEFAANGIRSNSAGRLFITDTVVRDNNGDGLSTDPGGSGTVRINIDGSRIEANGSNGIGLVNSTEASITNSIVSENGNIGMQFAFGTRGQVANCTVANNGNHGFNALGGAPLNIEYSVTRGNGGDGIRSGGGTVLVSNSVSTNNTGFGFNRTGGTFESRGNNTVRGNGMGDTSGVITPITGT